MTIRSGEPARILIVDDHPMVRDGLNARIANEDDLTVCGEAEDVDDALKMVAELKPDLAIIDISLKSGHGIDLMTQIRGQYPHVRMLVQSMFDESIYAERSLRAGALGYLNKQTAGQTVIDAIRAVLAGKTYLSPEMTDRVIKRRIGGALDPDGSPVESLSNRELEVFRLIGHGLTTSAIANQLFLSVHTIDTYREKLKSKLNLANSPALNRYAAQWVLENG